MTMNVCSRAALATLVLCLACVAHAQAQRPLLDALQAMGVGTAAVDSKAGRGDSTFNGPEFDQASNEWRMMIERGDGATYRRFFVSLNESSGVVCVHELASECARRDDAVLALQAARDKRRGLADAALNPPPDLQGVMVAVIRHQRSAGGYLAGTQMPLYVSLQVPGGGRPIDLSADAIRSLGDTGLQLRAGSAWKAPASGALEHTGMTMGVGTPTLRADGDYDITFGFWCGPLCASSHRAVLRHGASGWRVISSQMDWIS
jgi:hypothetical protein